MRALYFLTLVSLIFYFSRGLIIANENLKPQITFYDVGHGDAILIESGEYKILVDGGPGFSVDQKLAQEFFVPNCRLDAVILTHPHRDHLEGLTRVLDRCEVDVIYSNNVECSTKICEKWNDQLSDKNVQTLYKDDVLAFDQLSIYVLWPKEDFVTTINPNNLNDYSIVLLVDSNDFEALLASDAEKPVLTEILKTLQTKKFSSVLDGDLEVLKVPHQGAMDGFLPEFLAFLSPVVSVLSVGPNGFGHPDPEVIYYLESIGSQVLRTDEIGDINIVVE